MSYFQTEDYDKLFRFFFEVYVVAFTKGFATDEFEKVKQKVPSLNMDNGEKISLFLVESLSFLRRAYTPKVLDLLLDHLSIEIFETDIPVEQHQLINLSKHLIKTLYIFDINEFLFMSRFWSEKTEAYAETHFYPRLPIDIQEKYLHRY